MRRGRFGIRQNLFVVLLVFVITMTSLFLLLTGTTVSRQVERTSHTEMMRSRDTFRALERQRQDLLLRQTALLSELPSLKALMTTNDQETVVDAGETFWHTSGSDLFALMRPDGTLLALYSNGRPVAFKDCALALARSRGTPQRTTLILISDRLFEVATEPIAFAGGEQRRLLGYISTGYEWNDSLAAMIGRSPAGEVAFATPGRVIASTLDNAQVRELAPQVIVGLSNDGQTRTFRLGRDNFLTTAVMLQDATDLTPSVYLVLLKSDAEKIGLLRQLNGGILTLGALLLLAGGVMAFALAGTVTRPLHQLLRSTRQMERGEVIVPVLATGPQELRELSEAFEKMRAEVLSSQARLIEGERQATIGRLASSISHDLRHYLSPIYANAEFLSSQKLSPEDRVELLNEITEAARGMNELLDTILRFSRTGISLQLAPGSITAAVRRALAMVQSHPDAQGVTIATSHVMELAGHIDGKELQRAAYNLLLNGCQAARRSSALPAIGVEIDQDVDLRGNVVAAIRIFDNGEGVSDEVAQRLFEPFVSAGKESGIGLGLALVKRIVEAHGGSVGMQRMNDKNGGWITQFFLLIPSEPAIAINVDRESPFGVTQ